MFVNMTINTNLFILNIENHKNIKLWDIILINENSITIGYINTLKFLKQLLQIVD